MNGLLPVPKIGIMTDNKRTVSRFKEKSTLLSFEVTRKSVFNKKDVTVLNFSDSFAMCRNSKTELQQFWDLDKFRIWLYEHTIVIDKMAVAVNTKKQLEQEIKIFGDPGPVCDLIIPSNNTVVEQNEKMGLDQHNYKYKMDWIPIDFRLSLTTIITTNLVAASPIMLMFNIKEVITKTYGLEKLEKAIRGFGDSAHRPYEF